jgi:hypothetical protein
MLAAEAEAVAAAQPQKKSINFFGFDRWGGKKQEEDSAGAAGEKKKFTFGSMFGKK